MGVEVIKPEAQGFTPHPQQHILHLRPATVSTPTPGPAGGGWGLIPFGFPPLPGQQPYSQKWLLSLRGAH